MSQILVNVGDPKVTSNDDIRAFNELDSAASEKRFLILVNKGKEGWNCRSLCGVAMFRQPKSRSLFFRLPCTACTPLAISKKRGRST